MVIMEAVKEMGLAMVVMAVEVGAMEEAMVKEAEAMVEEVEAMVEEVGVAVAMVVVESGHLGNG